MTRDEKLVEVYRCQGEMRAQVVKSLLDSYGVPCVFRSNSAPSILMFTVDGLGEVRIMVAASMEAKAREVLDSKNVIQDDEVNQNQC